MLIKLGESFSIRPEDLQPLEKIAADTDLGLESRMVKFAEQLKVIAPQAKDFLYFTCVMMHAAEASLVNDDGSPKKLSNGEKITATWEKCGDDEIKWVCNDKSIMPYRNSNRDIFRSYDLKLAYKNWVGRPLCLDHQSQSVDKIRGVIVDTVYDDARHRVIALCALDKKNYPDLADKVSTGVSKDVSMGVAVGRAICSDCGKGARTEREFCSHMRNKSCYGEINTELNPIELSLVVNGADKKAKVKHIIASDVSKAAELLTDYLNLKEAANKVSTNDLESIKEELNKLTSKVEGLIDDSNDDDKNDANGPTRSKNNWAESIVSDSSAQVSAPEAFPTYASELQMAILGAQTKIASLQENVLRLSKSEESIMTTNKKNAYFLGTEEPTPGQKKYQADPLNEKAREQDKNLVNITNTGSDGLFPGDEQKKKDLLRLADENERALFREAALKKAKETLMSKGYFQGTEEPKAKKTTYTPDPLNEKDRQLDKQMVGKTPFPNTGKVEELFPGDKATKENVCRASLKARFEKVATTDGLIDRGASRWVVLANEQPILSATVDQITKGNVESLYDAVATERFGKSILNRIQTEGFEATASSLTQKKAQVPPAPAPMAPAPESQIGGMDDLTPPEAVGAEGGDPAEIVESLKDLTDELESKLSDLSEKVAEPIKEDAEMLGEVAPAGDEDFTLETKSASQLQAMRKRVNRMLQDGISETIKSLAGHIKEIKTASNVYTQSYSAMNSAQRNYLNKLTIEAVKDARANLNDTAQLMEAVVKYAYGTAEIQKRAQAIEVPEQVITNTPATSKTDSELAKQIDKETEDYIKQLDNAKADDAPKSHLETLEKKDPETAKALKGIGDMFSGKKDDTAKADDATVVTPKDNLGTIEKKDPETAQALRGIGDMFSGKDKAKADDGGYDENDLKLKPSGDDDTFEVVSASTKEDRAQMRAKLAEKAMNLGYNTFSGQAHKGTVSAIEVGNLDTKPTVDAGFHVLKDVQKAMQDLATAPPKVRKQAEMIQTLVVEGKLASEDVEQLVAHGVDQAAVKYWKAYFSESKDSKSKDFADKLTKEHIEAKKAAEMSEYKGKIKRAYDLANAMVARSMIDGSQVESQVGEIMNWNDAGFESMKNIVSKQATVKQASIPSVGLVDSTVLIPTTSFEKTASVQTDIKGIFDNYFESKGLKF